MTTKIDSLKRQIFAHHVSSWTSCIQMTKTLKYVSINEAYHVMTSKEGNLNQIFFDELGKLITS